MVFRRAVFRRAVLRRAVLRRAVFKEIVFRGMKYKQGENMIKEIIKVGSIEVKNRLVMPPVAPLSFA